MRKKLLVVNQNNFWKVEREEKKKRENKRACKRGWLYRKDLNKIFLSSERNNLWSNSVQRNLRSYSSPSARLHSPYTQSLGQFHSEYFDIGRGVSCIVETIFLISGKMCSKINKYMENLLCKCTSDTHIIKFTNFPNHTNDTESWEPNTRSLWQLPCWLRQYRIHLQCRRPRFNSWVGKIPWRREWLPTPVFLPGESHGQRSLEGCSLWGLKELNMTERLTQNVSHSIKTQKSHRCHHNMVSSLTFLCPQRKM